MSQRARLLLIFTLTALSALTFFAFIAYDTATETSRDKEVALLRQVFANDMKEAAAAIASGININAALARISHNHRQQMAIAVYDANSVVIYASPVSRPLMRLLARVKRNAQSLGQFADGGFSYTWFHFPLPAKKLTAVLVYEVEQAPAVSFLHQMGLSLGFTAFIVLWVASWAAVYISNLIDKLSEQKNVLEYHTLHDGLTGLPNRTMLYSELGKKIIAAKHEASQFALCFIDLNGFKDINDSLGHQFGDELLIEVAKRLTAATRASDMVARLGGDEFAILLRGSDISMYEIALQRLSSTLEAVIHLNTKNCFVSSSIGIALFPAHGADVQALLRNADMAMYSAKKSRLRYQFYNPGILAPNSQPTSEFKPAI